ncbi:uncharacterized protein LOC123531622 [Mercenaria mercenaria]|uniref:uncharacterized protein LOC123531622 n=1 Tax=Mercenaria mercenaria TaxID=6596 RepID=UPI00234F7CC3|nr:uncharacterized protein LOC123531622 [Mercenaria mercenaria]
MEIFSQFNRNSPMGTSIPQVLFKNLLSVKDENRTPFLAAAIGTNGVKQARLVLQAKKERLLQQLLAETLGATVDEALVTHPDEMEAIKQFSDTEVTKSRIPRCILDFLEKVRNSENVDDNTNIEIAITIKIDGKEVVGDRMNMIKRKGIKTMERLVKKMKTNNEE